MDAKVLSMVLANRLQQVIRNLVHPDQIICGRQGADSLRLVVELVSLESKDTHETAMHRAKRRLQAMLATNGSEK